MSNTEYLGARLEKDIIEMINKTADEEHVDKTKALKSLVILGRKQYLLKKHIEKYRQGRTSIDRAAELVGITAAEMMEEVVKAGIKSAESIEDYREGLNVLSNL